MLRYRRSHFALLTLVILTMVASPIALAKTSLRVQLILGAGAIKYIKENVVPEFEEKYDATVEIETVNWDNRMEKLLITTAGGVPPDIFMSGAEHVLELVDAGLVAPLDKEFSVWADHKDFLPPTFGSSQWEGRSYGVPLYTGPRVWWYRTDMFENAGLNPNAPPRNWADLLTAAKRLTRTDGQQVTIQGYDLSRWTGNAGTFGKMQDYTVFVWHVDGELFDENYEPLFTSPENLAALEYMIQLKEAVKPPGYEVVVPGGGGDALIKGAAAMYLAGGWVSSQVHEYAPDLLDSVRAIVPVPGEKSQVVNIFSDWLGIHAASPNKDLAWKFIQAVTSAKVLVDINAEVGLLSPRRSTITEFARVRPLSLQMYETVNYCRPWPAFPKTVQLIEAWSKQYTEAIEGRMGAQPAMEEASRQWRAILYDK